MNKLKMKKLLSLLCFVIIYNLSFAQESETITLPAPDTEKGLPLMKALSARASVREWSSQKLSGQDLSDLLWAANGINRADGRKTAPSAQNAQDVDIWVFMPEGIYFYNAVKHALDLVAKGNYMDLPGKTDAPVNLVLTTDISKFKGGSDSLRLGWGNIDTGIVSQNISLFCAGTGLKTRPRAMFPDTDKIREILKLRNTQIIILNHPVGYEKK
jgi:hypothetical protein